MYDFLRTQLYFFCNHRHWRRPLDDELPDLANLNDIHDLRTKEANKNDHIVWLSNSCSKVGFVFPIVITSEKRTPVYYRSGRLQLGVSALAPHGDERP